MILTLPADENPRLHFLELAIQLGSEEKTDPRRVSCSVSELLGGAGRATLLCGRV